jgi:hypothetical protein
MMKSKLEVAANVAVIVLAVVIGTVFLIDRLAKHGPDPNEVKVGVYLAVAVADHNARHPEKPVPSAGLKELVEAVRSPDLATAIGNNFGSRQRQMWSERSNVDRSSAARFSFSGPKRLKSMLQRPRISTAEQLVFPSPSAGMFGQLHCTFDWA